MAGTAAPGTPCLASPGRGFLIALTRGLCFCYRFDTLRVEERERAMNQGTPVRSIANPERIGEVMNPSPLSVVWSTSPTGQKIRWVEWATKDEIEEII